MKSTKTYEELLSEIRELHMQLEEANDAINAIKTGQVDALVINNDNGHQLYTLKSADQTYRVFIEKMKEGAVTLNKDEIILYSNSQFASMINLPLSKVIGLSLSDFIPHEMREDFKKLIKKGWESDSKGEISLKNDKNKLVPFLLSFTSLELDEGTSLSIILTDLTVQKETEKQLKIKNEQLEEARLKVSKMNEELEDIVKTRTKDLLVSREHFKFLADNIPVIVWTTLPDGYADYFNKQWYEYTGLNFEESKGSGSQQVLHRDDVNLTVQAWNEAMKKKTRFYFEHRIRRFSDGQYRWHLGKGEPLIDEGGNVVAWFGTSTDIEDQKKELDKKDEFISVASHELKTPLTSLKGYIELMGEHQAVPDEIKLYVSKANASVSKLQHLINDLLDISKIKAGKLKFNKKAFDLTSLIDACVEDANYMYPSHEIKKELKGEFIVDGNEERLEQVLMNLIDNAVKYSPSNKKIIVRAEKNSDMVTVSVIDFGVGMTTADQQKIFERFFRAEDSKLYTPGLGMGLYISSEIIKEHDGQINVTSQLNNGSVFSFSLPLQNTKA
jgi:two-component system phosphate regulon sensor histidine kinase PhoR